MNSLLSVFAILTHLSSGDPAFELPKTWAKDFTISLSHSGGMDGSSTNLTFTYDSCTYLRNSSINAPMKISFALAKSERDELLKKMHELNVDKIRSDMSMNVVNDGWSRSLCFGVHCIEGGTSAEMSEYDKNQFLNAYGYLENFALKKIKK